jgi:hypothetical protein
MSEVRVGNEKRFRGGLVFKAHRCLFHLTAGSRAIKKRKRVARNRSSILERHLGLRVEG